MVPCSYMTMTRQLDELLDGSHDREAFRYDYTLLWLMGEYRDWERGGDMLIDVNEQINDK